MKMMILVYNRVVGVVDASVGMDVEEQDVEDDQCSMSY